MRLAREPLLHFLIAGGLLFAAYGWLNRESADEPRTVRISVAEVNWLKETWARQWQRPPTEEELRGMVTDYLKETLLAREAAEIGLDENDTVIRRRLAQKMEFLVQDTARLAEPVEGVLRRFYSANQARYQAPARVSFSQVFFRNQADAQKGLAQLAARSPDELGDPSMLERDHAEADAQAVTSQFGDAFNREVFGLDAGPWHGPVASAYGFHLVRVSARQDAQPLPYEAVRAQVLEDWQREEQTQAGKRFFAELQKKYDVVVDDSVKPLVGPLAGAAR
jgi:parvulin-like peptidyl-prolyl isomerase